MKKRASAKPSEPDDFRTWQRDALAVLEKTTGSRVTTMRPKEWTRLYVSRTSPEDAASHAAAYQHNARVKPGRRR